jgi:hypothetical protein
VKQGSLCPLNSLMLHGLIYGQSAYHLNTDPGSDFQDEVRDYFGTGRCYRRCTSPLLC